MIKIRPTIGFTLSPPPAAQREPGRSLKNMKKIHISIASLFCLLTSNLLIANAGLILTEGQSFELEFNSIALDTFGGEYSSAEFWLSHDGLSDGDAVIFSVFEDNTSQTPLNSFTFTGNGILSPGLGGGAFFLSSVNPPWQDLQGAFRIEVESGSIELSGVSVHTSVGNSNYGEFYAVPEPATVILFGVGGLGAWILRRNKTNLTKT